MSLDLPLWASLLVAALVLFGAFLTLLGAFGLLRAPTFYSRAHPPTLGATMGMASVLLGSMVYFSVTGSRLFVHELLLIIALPVVAPVTMMLLARAALFRDRQVRRYAEEQSERARRVADELRRMEEEAAQHEVTASATTVSGTERDAEEGQAS